MYFLLTNALSENARPFPFWKAHKQKTKEQNLLTRLSLFLFLKSAAVSQWIRFPALSTPWCLDAERKGVKQVVPASKPFWLLWKQWLHWMPIWFWNVDLGLTLCARWWPQPAPRALLMWQSRRTGKKWKNLCWVWRTERMKSSKWTSTLGSSTCFQVTILQCQGSNITRFTHRIKFNTWFEVLIFKPLFSKEPSSWRV